MEVDSLTEARGMKKERGNGVFSSTPPLQSRLGIDVGLQT